MATALRSSAKSKRPESRGEGRESAPVVPLAAPKRRRPSWVLVGVLLVGLAALMGAWVFAATSERISVMVAARDVAPGEVITASDLRVVEMGKSGGLRAVQSSQQGLIIGRAAVGPIPAGTVLNTGLFAEKGDVIPAGQVVVGAALEPGAVPTAGLAAGDRVELITVVERSGSVTDAAPLAAAVLATGTVWSIEPLGSGGSSSKVWVSLLVPAEIQTVVAQATADGLLRLALVGGG